MNNPDEQSKSAQRVSEDDLEKTRLVDGQTESEQAGSKSDPKKWIGRTLGKYEITELLGVGGMGVVLRAHDTSIERDVAIKVLPADLAADEHALGRFLSEARSAGKLNHANTVTIHEISQDGDTHYIVMELVSGGSVGDHLQDKGAYSVADATRMIIEACRGLTAAHQAGVVHRDIKPPNLMLTPDGAVKVSDFGLAKRTNAGTLQMTQAGQMVGTPYFMSPEQCESKSVDARTDVYSLGATYYSLLTGKNPYENSDSVVQVMFAHCNSDRPDPRDVRNDVPPACAQIIERAMAIDPADRYQSTEAMRSDLEAVLAAISGTGIRLPSESGIRDSLPELKAPASDLTQTAVQNESQPAGTVHTGKTGIRPLILGGLAVITLAIAGFFVFQGNVGDDTGEQGGTAVVPPPSGDPIKVGILHSLTGTMADSESPVVDAALLAIEELNSSGGVLGRPVEAIVADGKSDSATFASEARRLIEVEGVSTVFGCWTSASRKTVVPIFEELDHLLIYPVQYEGIEESPNVIYTGAAPNQQIIPAVKWAFAFENKRKFFLVGSDYVFPRVAHEIIKDQLDILGAEVVGNEFLPLGSNDVQPTVEKIMAAKPDVILNCINGDTNTSFFTALRAAKITPESVPTISFSIGEKELRRMDVTAMTGDYAAWNYFQSIDTAENNDFVASFQEKYGTDQPVDDPMEAATFGVKLWAQAVAEADSTDVSAIRRAMRNQRMEAPSGDVRIDPATQHTFKTPRIGRVRSDGSFEVVWTAAKPEPPMPYPPTRSTEEWRALLHDLYTSWGNRWSAPSDE